MPTVVERLKRLPSRPGIAHLLRANQRFNNRLGNQFGAAVTYFSVLAVVPILLFAFSITGFILTVLDPAALDFVLSQLREVLAPLGRTAENKLLAFIETSLRQWAAPGIIGLLTAMYSGAGWAGNLKQAVRAQWVEDFDVQIQVRENIVIKTLKNFGVLIGLLVSVVVTFAIASVSTTLTTDIIDLIGLNDISWLKPVLHVVPIVFSIGAGWLVFLYLFLVLPETRAPWPALRRGALIGAVGLAVLQYGLTLLVQVLSGNKAIQLFGPVIIVMLFLNLFARLILLCAAWVATWEEPATEPAQGRAPGEFPAETRRRRVVAQSQDRGPGLLSAPTGGADHDRGGEVPAQAQTQTGAGEPIMVRRSVAARANRISMGAGYLTGAATGAGLGALLAVAAAKISGWRRRH